MARSPGRPRKYTRFDACGHRFFSVSQASKHFGKSERTVRRHLRAGTQDQLDRPRYNTTEVDDMAFGSLVAVAKYLEVSIRTVHRYVAQGKDLNDLLRRTQT